MAFDFNTFGQKDNQPVSSGGFDFNSFGSTPTQPTTQVGSSVPFPASPTDKPLQAGAKAVGNLPSSTTNFFKSLFDMVTSPVETGKGIFQVTKGAGAAVGREVLERTKLKEKVAQVPQTEDEQKARQVFQALKDRYGSLEALQKTATEDPFAFGADVAGLLAGGAGALGKTAEATRLAEKTAQLVTKPVGAVTKGVTETTGKIGKFGVSQATGLTPDTISQIAKTPEAFTPKAIATLDRESLGRSVKETIDARIQSMRSTGAGYEEIRQLPIQVKLKSNFLDETIKANGFEIKKGKITPTTKSLTRNESDIKALQNVYDNWSKKKTLTTEELLNLRSDLAEVSRFDALSGKTSASQTLAKSLRAKLNAQVRGQVPGLEELDRVYAKEADILKQIRKDYLQKDGSFKDGAVNKIANLTGKGKQQVLDRLEGIRPGITEEIKILRAIEDIDNAKGLKVGTYARAGLGIVGATTFNIPAIIGAILSTPEVAVRLIKAYGLTKNQAKQVTNIIKAMGSEVKNFKTQDAIKGFVDDFMSTKGGTPNKQGGFVRIGKETPKTVTPKSKVNESVSLPNDSIKKIDDNSFITTKPIKVYRGEGKGIGNVTFVKGKYFADSKEFAQRFGNVESFEIPKGAKVFDFDTIKNNPNQTVIPQTTLVDPEKLTKLLKDKGYTYTKNTNASGVEYVKLNRDAEILAGKLPQNNKSQHLARAITYDNNVMNNVEMAKNGSEFVDAIKPTSFKDEFFDYKRQEYIIDYVLSGTENKYEIRNLDTGKVSIVSEDFVLSARFGKTRKQLEQIWKKANKK